MPPSPRHCAPCSKIGCLVAFADCIFVAQFRLVRTCMLCVFCAVCVRSEDLLVSYAAAPIILTLPYMRLRVAPQLAHLARGRVVCGKVAVASFVLISFCGDCSLVTSAPDREAKQRASFLICLFELLCVGIDSDSELVDAERPFTMNLSLGGDWASR